MTLYIQLLESEVRRLRRRNIKLKYELKEANKTPMDRHIDGIKSKMAIDMYGGDLGGIGKLVDESIETMERAVFEKQKEVK